MSKTTADSLGADSWGSSGKVAVSIIVPTFNRAALLERTLEAIVRSTEARFEVILVDGASTDGTALVIAKWKDVLKERLVVVGETRREGFTKAVNKGFRAARGTYMTWINDDARPLANAYDFALEQLAGGPASVGLLALFHHCATEMNVAYMAIRNGQTFKVLHVRGTLYANFAFGLRTTFESAGYFDEGYFVKGPDPDLSLKIWHGGKRVVPAFQSLIDHDETEDDRRAADAGLGAKDNERLFAKWNLPAKNMAFNDFDPTRPCTLKGLRAGMV